MLCQRTTLLPEMCKAFLTPCLCLVCFVICAGISPLVMEMLTVYCVCDSVILFILLLKFVDARLNQLMCTFTIYGGVLLPSTEGSSGSIAQPHINQNVIEMSSRFQQTFREQPNVPVSVHIGLGIVIRSIAFVNPLWHYIFEGNIDWFPIPPHIEDIKHHSSSSTE